MSGFIRYIVLRQKCNLSPTNKFVNNASCFRFLHLDKPDKCLCAACFEKVTNLGKQLTYLKHKYIHKIVTAKKNIALAYPNSMESKFDRITGLLMLVLGRKILEEFYTDYIDNFYLEKNENPIPLFLYEDNLEAAYRKFFCDDKNKLASGIRARLPNMEPKDIARSIVGIHRKLRNFDGLYIKMLEAGVGLERMVRRFDTCSQDISPKERKIIDAIHIASLQFDLDEYVKKNDDNA